MKVLVDASLIIYLNVRLPPREAELVEAFWSKLVQEHDLYTNVLALDEALYVSSRKYDVPYAATLELIERVVLPFVEVLPLGLEEYLASRKYIAKYGLKPSDALHAATVEVHNLHAVASEDADFDRAGIARLWVTSTGASRA
ncbi:MAG: type II toxin-antitoxin system VapC family toxin [Thermofilum sp.]